MACKYIFQDFKVIVWPPFLAADLWSENGHNQFEFSNLNLLDEDALSVMMILRI